MCVSYILAYLFTYLAWQNGPLLMLERDCRILLAKIEVTASSDKILGAAGRSTFGREGPGEFKDFSCYLLMRFNLHIHLSLLHRLYSDTLSVLSSGMLHMYMKIFTCNLPLLVALFALEYLACVAYL